MKCSNHVVPLFQLVLCMLDMISVEIVWFVSVKGPIPCMLDMISVSERADSMHAGHDFSGNILCLSVKGPISWYVLQHVAGDVVMCVHT